MCIPNNNFPNGNKSCGHNGLKEELACHFPYAIFSVSLSLIILSLLSFANGGQDAKGAHVLFHSLHYLHLVFSGTGVILTFRKYSKNVLASLLVGIVVPAIFCTLSDAILPYLGGRLVGLDMHFHWCFVEHIGTVLPFLLVGIANGWVISSRFASNQLFYSAGSHFLHIFVSSMASILYLVSFGFSHWASHMGFVFLFMLFAVLAPCTLSDIIVPTLFARKNKKNFKAAGVDELAFCSKGKCDYENDSL